MLCVRPNGAMRREGQPSGRSVGTHTCPDTQLCYALHMADEVNAALARIDAALRRIEVAGTRPPAQSTAPELEARHARLRATVEDAVAALDKMIAGSAAHG